MFTFHHPDSTGKTPAKVIVTTNGKPIVAKSREQALKLIRLLKERGKIFFVVGTNGNFKKFGEGKIDERDENLIMKALKIKEIKKAEQERKSKEVQYIGFGKKGRWDDYVPHHYDTTLTFEPITGFYESDRENSETIEKYKDRRCESNCSYINHRRCEGVNTEECGKMATKFVLSNWYHILAFCEQCWDRRCSCDSTGTCYCPNHQDSAPEPRCRRCGTPVISGKCSSCRKKDKLQKMTSKEYVDLVKKSLKKRRK